MNKMTKLLSIMLLVGIAVPISAVTNDLENRFLVDLKAVHEDGSQACKDVVREVALEMLASKAFESNPGWEQLETVLDKEEITQEEVTGALRSFVFEKCKNLGDGDRTLCENALTSSLMVLLSNEGAPIQ